MVCSNTEAWKRPTESNSTPAMDLGHINIVLKWCMCMVVVGLGIEMIIVIIVIIMFCLSRFVIVLFICLFFPSFIDCIGFYYWKH